jgi:DNA gyrase subunit A
VTLINLSEGEKLSGIERIMDRDEENGENGNGHANGNGGANGNGSANGNAAASGEAAPGENGNGDGDGVH